VRSDSSGDFVGTVVMGRQLDRQLVVKLSEQTRLPFELNTGQALPQGLTPWPGVLSAGPFGAGDFWAAHEAGMYHLHYPLQDFLKHDVGLVSLDVSRDVHEEGEKLFRHVSQQLALTALVMVVLLAKALHFLLVRRLRRFEKQLVKLTEESSWQSRIDVQGSDELGVLSSKVNKLLEMIESHVGRLETLSLTDTLTGLPNRRAFDDRLALEYARKQRGKTSLAMLMLDIDHFKKYNDHYGHPAGDAALKATADVLRVAVYRSSDLVARLGGEEFAVLMPETEATEALKIANRIRSVMKGREVPHEASPVAPYMTFSIGVAIAGDETPEEFVNRVDQALYQAKNTGRDRAFCDAT
jgi:diguanylate cyclase (GGDEF)-like protein